VFSSNFDVNQNQHCCFAHGPAPSFPRPAHAFVHGPIMAHPDRTPPLRPCSRAATSGRPLPAPTGRAPLPAPDPGSPPSSFPPRGAPEPTLAPPFSSQMLPEPVPFSPQFEPPVPGATLHHHTAPASELAIRGKPRPSTASVRLRRPEILRQGATAEHHGAPKLPGRAEPTSSTHWCSIRLRLTHPHPISVSRPPPVVPLPFPPPASCSCHRPLVSTAAPPLSAVGGRLAGLAHLRPRLAGRAIRGWAALAGRRVPHCCCGPKAGPTVGFYFFKYFSKLFN
jgi:hypothetical protein